MQGRTKIFLTIAIIFATITNHFILVDRIKSIADSPNIIRPYAGLFTLIQACILIFGSSTAIRVANYAIEYGNKRRYYIDQQSIPRYVWILNDQDTLHRWGWFSWVANIVICALVMMTAIIIFVSENDASVETLSAMSYFLSLVTMGNILWIYAPYKYMKKVSDARQQAANNISGPVQYGGPSYSGSTYSGTTYHIKTTPKTQSDVSKSKKKWWKLN